MKRLAEKHCNDLPSDFTALTAAEVTALGAELSDAWAAQGATLVCKIKTKNFSRALMLTNAIGYVAEDQGHHPDVKLGWGYVEVAFTTHDVGGLSEKDFICAAHIDAMGLTA